MYTFPLYLLLNRIGVGNMIKRILISLSSLILLSGCLVGIDPPVATVTPPNVTVTPILPPIVTVPAPPVIIQPPYRYRDPYRRYPRNRQCWYDRYGHRRCRYGQ